MLRMLYRFNQFQVTTRQNTDINRLYLSIRQTVQVHPLFCRLFVSSQILLNHLFVSQSPTNSFIGQLRGQRPLSYGFVEGVGFGANIRRITMHIFTINSTYHTSYDRTTYTHTKYMHEQYYLIPTTNRPYRSQYDPHHFRSLCTTRSLTTLLSSYYLLHHLQSDMVTTDRIMTSTTRLRSLPQPLIPF